jgi:hypothetical protein
MKKNLLPILLTCMAIPVLSLAETSQTNTEDVDRTNTSATPGTTSSPSSRRHRNQPTNTREVDPSIGTIHTDPMGSNRPSDINNPMPNNQNNSGAPAGMGNTGTSSPAPAGTPGSTGPSGSSSGGAH